MKLGSQGIVDPLMAFVQGSAGCNAKGGAAFVELAFRIGGKILFLAGKLFFADPGQNFTHLEFFRQRFFLGCIHQGLFLSHFRDCFGRKGLFFGHCGFRDSFFRHFHRNCRWGRFSGKGLLRCFCINGGFRHSFRRFRLLCTGRGFLHNDRLLRHRFLQLGCKNIQGNHGQ